VREWKGAGAVSAKRTSQERSGAGEGIGRQAQLAEGGRRKERKRKERKKIKGEKKRKKGKGRKEKGERNRKKWKEL
jgi:hypothetical protein